MYTAIISVLKNWDGENVKIPSVKHLDISEPHNDVSSEQGISVPDDTTRKQEENTPKKKRKSAPKVKSGCLTCRSRRVKCDEGKPSCLRCQKLHLNCAGYQPLKASLDSTDPSSIPSRPLKAKPLASSPLLLAPEIHPGSTFKNNLEHYCFRYFVDDMSLGLTGTLWQRAVPQASEMQPFIRDVVIAVGALGLGKSTCITEAKDIAEARWYAVKKYGESLKGMREAIERGESDVRCALLACLLAFCFESLQGNQTKASIHATGGLTFVSQLALTSQSLKPKSHTCLRLGCCSTPAGLDSDLYQAFAGLDIQALFFNDTRSPASHVSLKHHLTASISRMPLKFETLSQAVTFWELLLRRNCHFIALARHELRDLQATTSFLPGDTQERNDAAGGTKSPPKFFDAAEIPPHILAEQATCVHDLQRFKAAASHLFTSSSSSSPAPARPRSPDSAQKEENIHQNATFITHVLKIQLSLSFLTLSSALSPPPLHWDLPVYEAHFDQIVRSVTVVLELLRRQMKVNFNGVGRKPYFRFDVLVVPALFLTGILCRKKEVREAVIDVFKGMGEYREGVWVAGGCGKVVEWVEGMEERDEKGEVKEGKRVVLGGVGGEGVFSEREGVFREREEGSVVVKGWQGRKEVEFVMERGEDGVV